jgi:hypothetical protein
VPSAIVSDRIDPSIEYSLHMNTVIQHRARLSATINRYRCIWIKGQGKSTLSTFISYGLELKSGDKRVESLPTAIYRFVESLPPPSSPSPRSSLAVMYGGWTISRGSTCRQYNPHERNVFRFRGSRRIVSSRRRGRIRTKIGTKLVLPQR